MHRGKDWRTIKCKEDAEMKYRNSVQVYFQMIRDLQYDEM